MNTRWTHLLQNVVVFFVILAVGAMMGRAAPSPEPAAAYAVQTAPVIDGDLGDDTWQRDSLTDGLFATYSPMKGQTLPFRTRVWVAYDRENLYIAFHCLDPEPDKIKTSVAKRDTIFSDDWVGLIIDTFNSNKNGYELFVNPSGMQGDALFTISNGEDMSPDWVWESAGRVRADGYAVEVRLPLRNIRFQSGDLSHMGIWCFRRISRLGISGSWPELPEGVNPLQATHPVSFRNLASSRNLEILPSFTYSRNTLRESPAVWGEADRKANIGVGVKYALTSSINAEMTVNPDFSQVESDAFQVLVNQRYPVFYEEKRPFFMETNGIFNLAGTGGDTNMWRAIHTRTIIDPDWGVKMMGDAGRTTFGVLAASDGWPGQEWDGEVNPHVGQNANYVIGRALYSLTDTNYIGGIFSDREFAGGFNRVAGGDAMFRFGQHHRLGGMFLYSASRDEDTLDKTEGFAGSITYNYNTTNFGVWACVEEYSGDFRMDTAFYREAGFRKATLYIGPQFQPTSKKWSWIKKVNPFVFGFVKKDTATGINDALFLPAIRFNFTKMAWFRFDWLLMREGWSGRSFRYQQFRMRGNIQATNWLGFGGSLHRGEDLYYDADDPFVGDSLSAGLDFTLQPNRYLKQTFSWYQTRLTRPGDQERMYTVNIINSQTTFQLNKHFFVRATARYDSYQHKLLTDFLASYTYVPGTVVHFGYGTLFEKQEWQDDGWAKGAGAFTASQRSLFFKVSYRWQL